MKPKLLLLFLLLVSPAIYAQQDTAKLNIPLVNKKINYQETVTLNGKHAKGVLYTRAVKWLLKKFPGNKVNTADNAAGNLYGTGVFKVPVNTNGNYFWLKFKIDINIGETAYTISINDFYEKPIEKGISNEYSKIGYRWWDYSQGHPWSAEDKPLFIGLDKNSRALLASFKAAMDK